MSRRPPPRPPAGHSVFDVRSLLSFPNFTLIISWRGQIIIYTGLVIVGCIYIVLRHPINDYFRRRREAISRARQQELMSAETTKESLASPQPEKDKSKDKGREKKKEKEVKKKRASSLKPDSGTESNIAGPSVLQSPPIPKKLAVPKSASKTPSRSPSPSPQQTPVKLPPSTPEHRKISATAPRIRVREPTSEAMAADLAERDVDETPRSAKSTPFNYDLTRKALGMSGTQSRDSNESEDEKHLLTPEQIPLPESPAAGPSRLAVPRSEAGDGSDTTSNASELSRSRGYVKSDGYSIMPDEGWLPVIPNVSKSKKKKNRQAQLESLGVKSPSTSTVPVSTPSQTPARTPRRRNHSRQDSLQSLRPINGSVDDYEEHMDRMETVIDSLRGELGAAIATGQLAREAEEEARQNELQAREELEIVKQRSASESSGKPERSDRPERPRTRESDLAQQLEQTRRHNDRLYRQITELQKHLQNSGGPPPSPYLMGPSSPYPQMNGHGGLFQPNVSPMVPPGSPFGMGFPSPGLGGPSGPIPTHHMYPSPMLHPNAHMMNGNGNMINMNGNMNGNGNGLHIQTPLPFRRNTSSSINDVFAGPLTPGTMSSAPSPYHFDLGQELPPIPLNMATSPGPGSGGLSPMALPQDRRASIEASVMRKVSGHLLCAQDDDPRTDAIAEEQEGEVIDLGEEFDNGHDQDHVRENGVNGSGDVDPRSSLSPPSQSSNLSTGPSVSSNPPSPSPQSRLLTPSQLNNISILDDTSSVQSGSSAHGKRQFSGDDAVSNASGAEANGGGSVPVTRPVSPVKPLWASDLTAGQLAQRMRLAALREQREAAQKALKDSGGAAESAVVPS